jgi:hypothetical protein
MFAILISINSIIMIIGGLVFICGLVLAVDVGRYTYIVNAVAQGPIHIIFAGLTIASLGVMGIVGITFINTIGGRIIIGLYWVFQVVCVLYANLGMILTQMNPDNVRDIVRERIYPQYESNAKIHKFVDSLQQELKCCGSDCYLYFINQTLIPNDGCECYNYDSCSNITNASYITLPDSCCSSEHHMSCNITNAYQEGCADRVYDDLAHNTNYIVTLVAGMALYVQIVLMIVLFVASIVGCSCGGSRGCCTSCCIRCCCKKKKLYQELNDDINTAPYVSVADDDKQ